MGRPLAGQLVKLVQKENWAELTDAVKSDAKAAEGVDAAGRSLLHYVLWKQAPENVAAAVFDAHRAAAKAVDRDGRHPLHFAMCRSASSGLVGKVLKAAPAGNLHYSSSVSALRCASAHFFAPPLPSSALFATL